MTGPLRLHYAPDNASLCVRLALEELGYPYQTILVDRSQAAHKTPAFRALNPNGLIPVLDTPHGPMFETAAILMWLAEENDALMPARGTPQRQHALQWMHWLSNTLHASLRMMFYPGQYTNGDLAAVRETAGARVVAHLDILTNARTAQWLEEDATSALSCYLAPMLRWAALYGGGDAWFDLRRWPRLFAFARRIEARPASQNAALAEGLGHTPFSAPAPCHPPEGSAI